MGGVMDIFDVLYAILPQWAVFVLVGIGLLCIAPTWYRWVQSKKVKGLLRNYASTTDIHLRAQIEPKLWAQVGESTARLTVCAQAAQEMGLIQLCRKAEERLIQLGSPVPFRGPKVDPKNTIGRLHPIEVSVRVTQLLKQGLIEPAETLIDDALVQHPNDPDLHNALQEIQSMQRAQISDSSEIG